MTNSFVFYKSFYQAIKLLQSDSEKWQILSAIFELAFDEKEADLDEFPPMIQAIYLVICEQIKASIQHKIDGAKGGKQKGINYKNKNTPLNTPLNTNVNVNVNDNVNVNENVNEPAPLNPSPFSIPSEEYSKKLFDVFKENGLPCARGNEISFLQRDFKNGIAFLHSQEDLKTVHSDDIIQACENYAKVVTSGGSWFTGKYSFDRFVRIKNFRDFLPDNFVAENFIKSDTTQNTSETGFIKKQYCKCLACNQTKLFYDNEKQKYVCDNCGQEYSFEEVTW